jgi:hypothetical protein
MFRLTISGLVFNGVSGDGRSGTAAARKTRGQARRGLSGLAVMLDMPGKAS